MLAPRSSLEKALGAPADAFSLPDRSITPRGSRTSSPSTVARFNSVSVIASGSVKLLFSSVINACRSAGPNELTTVSVAGVVEGDAAASALGFLAPLAVLDADGGGAVDAGGCAERFAAKSETLTEQNSYRGFTVICRC